MDGYTMVSGLAAGRFTNDGHEDLALALAGSVDAIELFQCNGNGGFNAIGSVSLGPQGTNAPFGSLSGWTMATGDFNGDGNLDIAVTADSQQVAGTVGADRLFVLLGNGKGGLTIAPGGPIKFSADRITWMAAGHFTSAGQDDLALVTAPPNSSGGFPTVDNLTVMHGTSTGVLVPFNGTYSLGPWSLYTSIVTGDFNNDGNQDIVAYNPPGRQSTSGQVSLFTGDGQGNFTLAKTTTLSEYPPTALVAAADFNDDGQLDLVMTAPGGELPGNGPPYPDGLPIYLGNPDGSFTLASDGPTVGYSVVFAATIGDFNEDGRSDLVFTAVAPSVTTAEYVVLNTTPYPPGTLVAGSGQKTTVNTTFPTALEVAVTDSSGNPTPGVPVTFTLPASGAGGTFAGSSTNQATVDSDTRGQTECQEPFSKAGPADAHAINHYTSWEEHHGHNRTAPRH